MSTSPSIQPSVSIPAPALAPSTTTTPSSLSYPAHPHPSSAHKIDPPPATSGATAVTPPPATASFLSLSPATPFSSSTSQSQSRSLGLGASTPSSFSPPSRAWRQQHQPGNLNEEKTVNKDDQAASSPRLRSSRNQPDADFVFISATSRSRREQDDSRMEFPLLSSSSRDRERDRDGSPQQQRSSVAGEADVFGTSPSSSILLGNTSTGSSRPVAGGVGAAAPIAVVPGPQGRKSNTRGSRLGAQLAAARSISPSLTGVSAGLVNATSQQQHVATPVSASSSSSASSSLQQQQGNGATSTAPLSSPSYSSSQGPHSASSNGSYGSSSAAVSGTGTGAAMQQGAATISSPPPPSAYRVYGSSSASSNQSSASGLGSGTQNGADRAAGAEHANTATRQQQKVPPQAYHQQQAGATTAAASQPNRALMGRSSTGVGDELDEEDARYEAKNRSAASTADGGVGQSSASHPPQPQAHLYTSERRPSFPTLPSPSSAASTSSSPPLQQGANASVSAGSGSGSGVTVRGYRAGSSSAGSRVASLASRWGGTTSSASVAPGPGSSSSSSVSAANVGGAASAPPSSDDAPQQTSEFGQIQQQTTSSPQAASLRGGAFKTPRRAGTLDSTGSNFVGATTAGGADGTNYSSSPSVGGRGRASLAAMPPPFASTPPTASTTEYQAQQQQSTWGRTRGASQTGIPSGAVAAGRESLLVLDAPGFHSNTHISQAATLGLGTGGSGQDDGRDGFMASSDTEGDRLLRDKSGAISPTASGRRRSARAKLNKASSHSDLLKSATAGAGAGAAEDHEDLVDWDEGRTRSPTMSPGGTSSTRGGRLGRLQYYKQDGAQTSDWEALRLAQSPPPPQQQQSPAVASEFGTLRQMRSSDALGSVATVGAGATRRELLLPALQNAKNDVSSQASSVNGDAEEYNPYFARVNASSTSAETPSSVGAYSVDSRGGAYSESAASGADELGAARSESSRIGGNLLSDQDIVRLGAIPGIRPASLLNADGSPLNSKNILTIALQKAQNAVTLDGANNVPEAIAAYKQAVRLLDEVMERIAPRPGKKARSSREEERRRLRVIHDTYADRIRLLSTIYSPEELAQADSLQVFSADPKPDLLVPRTATSRDSYDSEKTKGILRGASFETARYEQANAADPAPAIEIEPGSPLQPVTLEREKEEELIDERHARTPSDTSVASTYSNAALSPPNALRALPGSGESPWLSTRSQAFGLDEEVKTPATAYFDVEDGGSNETDSRRQSAATNRDSSLSYLRRSLSSPALADESPTTRTKRPVVPPLDTSRQRLAKKAEGGVNTPLSSGAMLVSATTMGGTISQRRRMHSSASAKAEDSAATTPFSSRHESGPTPTSPVADKTPVGSLMGRQRATSQPSSRRPQLPAAFLASSRVPPVPALPRANAVGSESPANMPTPRMPGQSPELARSPFPARDAQKAAMARDALFPRRLPSTMANHMMPSYANDGTFSTPTWLPPEPRSPQTPGALPMIPANTTLRPFVLMRLLSVTLSSHGQLSRRLSASSSVWAMQSGKLQALDSKLRALDLISSALETLEKTGETLLGGNVKDDSGPALVGARFAAAMEEFESLLEEVQNTLAKKLSFIPTVSGKKASGGLGSLGSRLTRGFDRMTNAKNSAEGPHAYTDLLVKVCTRSQLLERHSVAVARAGMSGLGMGDDPRGDQYSSVSIESRQMIESKIRRTGEFFASVILTFVLRDLSILLDKSLKRCTAPFIE